MKNVAINTNKEQIGYLKPNFKSGTTPSQAQTTSPEVQLPDIYYNPNPGKEKKSLVEKIKPFDFFGAIVPWLETPLLMGGTCFALSKALDKYSEACGGEYEKSILGKAAKLGDDIEKSKFIKSKPAQKVIGFIDKGATKINNLLKRSSLITAIRTTPARPEKSTPKHELIPQKVRFLDDFFTITDKLKLNSEGVAKLKDLGLDKTEKEFLKKLFGNEYKKAPIELTSNTIQLKRLGFDESKIAEIVNSGDITAKTKQAVLDTLGMSIDDIKNMRLKPEEYVNKIKEAVTKAGKKVRIGDGHVDFLGPIQPLERTISCDQVANRLRSVMDKGISKTGNFLVRAIHKIHRGFTFGGGKGGMWIFIAPSLVMMLRNLKKADKSEKVGTVAKGSIDAISWVITFPLSIAATYALGGMRFAGMSKDKVKEFMNKTDAFNKLVDEGKLMDKSKYDAALKVLKEQRKNLRNVDKQNLFARMVKNITNFFYADLNTIRSYKNGNFLMDKIRQIPNFFKHLGLEPIRFALCVFVFESLFRGAIEKGTKAIFGNHYDNYKEEENIAKKKEQKKFTKEDLQERLYEAQALKMTPVQQIDSENSMQNNKTIEPMSIIEPEVISKGLPKNSVEQKAIEVHKESKKEQNIQKDIKKVEENVDNYTYIPSQYSTIKTVAKSKRDNYTYIPSSKNILNEDKNKNEKNKKYIPAQVAGNFVKSFDNSGLNAALRRADLAEQKALQILAGKFQGI